MKQHILTILFILLFLPVISSAQQIETVFDGDVSHGGFGSILVGVTSVNGEISYLRGTRAAWMLKLQNGHAVNIGVGGYRTQSGFDAVNWSHPDIDDPELRANYGGFEVEYLNRSNRLIHYGVQATVGGGTVRYRDSDIDLSKTSDSFFSFQPGANAHLNITNWFRISGGVFYRYTSGVSLDGTSNSDLSGLTGMLGFRFGWF